MLGGSSSHSLPTIVIKYSYIAITSLLLSVFVLQTYFTFSIKCCLNKVIDLNLNLFRIINIKPVSSDCQRKTCFLNLDRMQ